MTVEIVNYISDLDDTNPKGSDKIAEGDNHIRNIKHALTETFPNIDGPVTATQDEINQLAGLTDPVEPSLPEAPSQPGSMLHNTGVDTWGGHKWSETTTIKIVGDKAYIPAFAGLGNVNLYVNNEGEILATEMATDPSLQHDLNFHTDVDFDGTPGEDDLLIHDGTAWKAKRFEGGNVMNPIKQPASAGDFSMYQSPAEWQAKLIDGTKDVTFTVPDGLKFILTDIKLRGSVAGGGTWYAATVDYPDILLDGIDVYGNISSTLSTGGNYEVCLFSDENQGINDPTYQIKDGIDLKVWSNSVNNLAVICGYFVEDK